MLIKGYELDPFIDDMARWNRKHQREIENLYLRAENTRLVREKQNLGEALVHAEEKELLMRDLYNSVCEKQSELKNLVNTINDVIPFAISEFRKIEERKIAREEQAAKRERKRMKDERRRIEAAAAEAEHKRKIEEEHKKREAEELERKDNIRKKLEQEAKLMGKMFGVAALSKMAGHGK